MKVKITAQATISYSRTLDISDDEYARYQAIVAKLDHGPAYLVDEEFERFAVDHDCWGSDNVLDIDDMREVLCVPVQT